MSSVMGTPLESELVHAAFSTEQALQAAGISRRRLQDWVERGIISPGISRQVGRRTLRLYTFRNLVELRAALWLRQYLSLRLIESLVLKLRDRGEDYPLATMSWAIIEHSGTKRAADVLIRRSDGAFEHPTDGQILITGVLPLEQFADEVRNRIDSEARRRRRPGKVERRRGSLGSTPVFAGTRVPVATVRRLHDAGWSEQRILENYPMLKRADVRVALTG